MATPKGKMIQTAYGRSQPILWWLENAPTVGCLIDVAKEAAATKGVAQGMKAKWSAAMEARYVWLKQNPPQVVSVGVAEAMGIHAMTIADIHKVSFKMDDSMVREDPEAIANRAKALLAECAKSGITHFEGANGSLISFAEYFQPDFNNIVPTHVQD